MPHGPIQVSPSSNRSLDVAVRLRLPDRTLDERGLGFSTNCNRHLKSNNGRLVVALHRHLDSAVTRTLGVSQRANPQ